MNNKGTLESLFGKNRAMEIRDAVICVSVLLLDISCELLETSK
jgi:hypothetical protein